MNNGFSKKDLAFRDYVLTADPMRLLLKVCTPLALYQAFNQLFKIMDNLMAAYIGPTEVSSVAYMNQVTAVLTALGSGLAVGGSIRISEAYGQGDDLLVKKRVATVYAIAMMVSIVLTLLLIPLAEPLLRLINTPQELIDNGVQYFRVEVLSLIVTFFNSTYIAVERSRGHSSRIMMLNIAMTVVKLSLSLLGVYVLEGGLMSIALSTLVGHLLILVCAIIHMTRDEGVFHFSLENVTLKKHIVLPMLKLSYPVAMEKIMFSAGKVVVSSMSALYGAVTVGALAISNNIASLTTCWHMGFSDGAAPLISQNRGAGKHRRSLQIFTVLLLLNVVIGIVGLLLVQFTLPMLADMYASSRQNYDESFRNVIMAIHLWEMFGYITLGIHSAVAALLLGYGYTRLTMLINAARVFIYRAPVLWLFQNFTTVGAEAVGMTMMISNVATGLTAVIVAIPIIRQIQRKAVVN